MEMSAAGKVAKIGHGRLAPGRSIPSIAQDLGVSRHAVRKVPRRGAGEAFSGPAPSEAR